ncbi:putative tyrosine-protein kinase [Apostichopus japonicus]|uniref:non-specific protein-tyrosine kinase n=1 Tax=Stichopus japonicus TaxID=307972 RepID=A0A2G8LF49_STIJA|nr:putative tyrosine-protein kinase [Apostichopus japonicus]
MYSKYYILLGSVTEFAPLRSLAENIKQEALKASFPVTLLVEFSVQITDAMRYLHSSNIIHRDLATRNILLFINEVGTKTVKISDFGLSRRLLLGENYRSEMKPHLKLPLAWMPVEALTKLTFTKASDVYSFGVTMWEMFSYGCQPWATRSGEEILKAIDKPNFQRLEDQRHARNQFYDMMLKVWSHQPEDRPTFAELHSDLPMTKPLQVRAVSSHVASSPDELTFRTDDIITVIEKSDKSGMWTGVSPLGKVGKFECTKTSAAGGGPGPTSPTREKKGSKAKRAKSGKSKEVKKRCTFPGKLTKHKRKRAKDACGRMWPAVGFNQEMNISVNPLSLSLNPTAG